MSSLLSRRNLLAMGPLSLTAQLARAAAPDRGAMMWEYLTRQVTLADEARIKKMAAVRTKEQLSGLREKVLKVLHTGIGAFPERTPLNAKVVGEIVKDDYIIEKIIYESQP